MSNDKYESELTATREEVAEVLRGATEGVTTGSVRLGSGKDGVVVDIPEEVTLEIELETEDEGLSLEFELEWSHPEVEESPVSTEDLSEEEEEGSVPVGAADKRTPAQFELFRDKGDEWRWRLRHRNGNIIATSGEGYTRKHNAKKAINSVIRNSPRAVVTEDSGD